MNGSFRVLESMEKGVKLRLGDPEAFDIGLKKHAKGPDS